MSEVPMIAPLENTLNVRSAQLTKCLNSPGSLLEGVFVQLQGNERALAAPTKLL